MVFLNGKFLPIEQAMVPVLDRGFIFGDGVYELVPVYSRVPFRIDEHLRRLERSLAEVRITESVQRGAVEGDHHAPDRRAAVRGSGNLFPGDARRRQTRPRIPQGRRTDGVHHVQSAGQPGTGAGRKGRGGAERGRQSLAALRHQVDLAYRQLPAAPDLGRCGRGGNHHVPRRQPDRGLGFERVHRQGRRDPLAGQIQPDPARHHLRRGGGAGAVGGDAARVRPGSAKPRCARRTKCGSRPRRRRSWRSSSSTAGRSETEGPARRSGACTSCTRNSSSG